MRWPVRGSPAPLGVRRSSALLRTAGGAHAAQAPLHSSRCGHRSAAPLVAPQLATDIYGCHAPARHGRGAQQVCAAAAAPSPAVPHGWRPLAMPQQRRLPAQHQQHQLQPQQQRSSRGQPVSPQRQRLKWQQQQQQPRHAAAGAAAATSGSSVPRPPQPQLQRGSELQALINSIPFRRLALWAFVGGVAWQLHEFFGVSATHMGVQ